MRLFADNGTPVEWPALDAGHYVPDLSYLQGLVVPELPTKMPDVMRVKLSGQDPNGFDVNSVTVTLVEVQVDAAKRAGAKKLFFEVNSTGGSTYAGGEFVRYLEHARLRTYCVVDGSAYSEAFYILQGCDRRVMTSRSDLMVHEPYSYVRAGERVEFRRATMAKLMRDHEVVVKTWTAFAGRRLKCGVQGLRKRIRNEEWSMDSDEALAAGAVDRVVDSTEQAWDLFMAGKL